MRVILKVRRKGVVILPKRIREALGVSEGEEVVVEVLGDKLVMRALKPLVVDVSPELVERVLREERDFEEPRYSRMIRRGEAGPRR